MGQYFKAVNTKKKQYVCPWCIGGGAKLWEWAANDYGSIFVLLLRLSDEGGGGDIDIDFDGVVGSWAHDPVVLVGDYDSSSLYEAARGYTNITPQIAKVWNDFVEPKQPLNEGLCESCAVKPLNA